MLQGISAQVSIDKKAFKEKFQEAEYFFLRGEFREAAFLYHELLKADPTNANLQFLTGASYLSIDGQKERAIPFLEKAVSSVSPGYREGLYRERNAPREAFFALGRAYHIQNRFDEALEYYEKYKNVMPLYNAAEIEYAGEQITSVKIAKQMIMDTLSLVLQGSGEDVNNSVNDYHAVFSGKDSVMVYMSQKPFYSAIMMTTKKDGKWDDPVNLNDQIQLGGNCEVTDISADGSELYLVKQEELDKNLYISHYRKGRWSIAEKLEAPVNSPWDESHASISADMKTLCFTSNRPGGTGAMDIYFSKKKTDGTWSEPVNAGKTINTIYSEETPFLSRDGKTLFFSSMGHASMGGFDIFYSTQLPDGTWSVPANIGFPVSSCDDDLFYFPLNNGKNALYSSYHKPMPAGKVLWLGFDNSASTRTSFVEGTLTMDDNRDIDPSTEVKIVDRRSGDTIDRIVPNPLNGEYIAEVRSNDFGIVVSADKYNKEMMDLTINPEFGQKNIRVETNLRPDEVASGEYLVIKNVLFDYDKSVLSREALVQLEILFQVMTNYPDIFVQVRGHTDSRGKASYNLMLSRRRARSVVDYLVSRGISRERFISSGVGEMENIARNENPDGSDNPEGRRLNRQVEIRLINNDYDNIVVDEIKVPESLKPIRDKHYHVILEQTDEKLTSFPEDVLGQKTRLFETDNGYLYTVGPFNIKTEASAYLNRVTDKEFTEAKVVEEHEFNRLLLTTDFSIRELNGPFTIQLLALRNEAGFTMFKNPQDIQLFEGSDGFHRYVTGYFENYDDARDATVKYADAGFPDAIVMPLSRYLPVNADSIADSDLEYYFTIQLTATKNKPDPSIYSQIPGVRITRENDGFYRISEGVYLSKTQAEKALGRMRKSGFDDAFIRKIHKQTEESGL